jgi:hypothetical protein
MLNWIVSTRLDKIYSRPGMRRCVYNQSRFSSGLCTVSCHLPEVWKPGGVEIKMIIIMII